MAMMSLFWLLIFLFFARSIPTVVMIEGADWLDSLVSA
jgi:hypothetical protein